MPVPIKGKYESEIQAIEPAMEQCLHPIEGNSSLLRHLQIIKALYCVANEISINTQVLYDRS